MRFLIETGLVLLALKLLWNAALPWDMAWRERKGTLRKGQGVSFMPHLDLILYLGILALNALGPSLAPTKTLVLWGGLGIAGSYLLFFLGGILAHYTLGGGKGTTEGK